jgi:hypothetical protein
MEISIRGFVIQTGDVPDQVLAVLLVQTSLLDKRVNG